MTGVFAAIGLIAVTAAIAWAWTKSKQPKDKK